MLLCSTYDQGEYLAFDPFAGLWWTLSTELHQSGQESFEFRVISERVGRRTRTYEIQLKKNKKKIINY